MQNLIRLKHENIILSTIESSEITYAGYIYLKKPLTLNWSAEEISLRWNELMGKMIYKIVKMSQKLNLKKEKL